MVVLVRLCASLDLVTFQLIPFVSCSAVLLHEICREDLLRSKDSLVLSFQPFAIHRMH